MARPAGVEAADQPPVGGEIDRHHLVPFCRLDVGDRRQRAEHPGIGDQDVEPAMALEDHAAQPVDGVEIGEIEGRQRRFAAGRAHRVVGLLQPAGGTAEQDQPGALGGEAPRHRGTDAARRAGDERDAPGQPAASAAHGSQTSSASSESCAVLVPPTMSVRSVG